MLLRAPCRWLLGAFMATLPLSESRAVEYQEIQFEGKRGIVCRVNVKKEKLELFLRDDEGLPLKSFVGIDRYLNKKGRVLVFGMNAGMYHPGFAPVGMFVAGGKTVTPLNLSSGEGNFFLKPNGVFLLTSAGARVLESSEVTRLNEPVELATQSGPLLVRAGKIHPVFKPDSVNRLIRNGVGVPSPDVAIFVIMHDVINLHEFSRLFRDELKCPDALYLDGTVCSLYAPPLKRADQLIDLGPIIGITAEK